MAKEIRYQCPHYVDGNCNANVCIYEKPYQIPYIGNGSGNIVGFIPVTKCEVSGIVDPSEISDRVKEKLRESNPSALEGNIEIRVSHLSSVSKI